jgi:HD-GYP domain-containing protein (c-di-GMP phosphodiesterase class II)
MFKSVRVGVNQLKIGMYVAELDRPWLETPFLFQGFYIRGQDEIDELRKFCDYVYIYLETGQDAAGPARGRLPWIPERLGGTVRDGRRRGWLRLRSRRRRHQDLAHTGIQAAQRQPVYKETTGLKEEVANATGVHKEAVETVHAVMTGLRLSDKLDVQRLETAVNPMVDSILRNPAALAYLIRLQNKGDYLYRHSLASLVWATVLGRHIGLNREDLNVVALGAMLLDMGKIRLPDEILEKPTKLTDEEYALMKRHVEFGLEILKETKEVDERVMDMVAHHHERFNGSGYPNGLRGSQVPVFARIAGIVDAYDAMITPRSYAKPMSSFDAFRQLRLQADIEFQAELIDQFTQAIGVFPTGTLVELNTGQIAVVTKQNRVRRLRPEIMVIMNPEKEFLDSFSVIDLNRESGAEHGRETLWIEHGLAPGSFGIDPTEFFLD